MPVNLREDEVLVIPARERKVCDKLWIRQIVINTPSPLSEGSVVVEYGPWNGDPTCDASWRDADGNDTAKRIEVKNVYSLMKTVPELHAVFAAIMGAVEPIRVIDAENKKQADSLKDRDDGHADR